MVDTVVYSVAVLYSDRYQQIFRNSKKGALTSRLGS